MPRRALSASSRLCAAALVWGSVSAPSFGQSPYDPPRDPLPEAPWGAWLGPGQHCVTGLAITLPDGVEGSSFGLGMEFRTTDGRDLGELVTGPANGAPGFDGFIEGLVDADGCVPGQTMTIDGPRAVDGPPLLVQRTRVTCEGPDGAFGVDLARFSFNADLRVGFFILLFGDNGWTVGETTLPAERTLPAEEARPLFDALIGTLDFCDPEIPETPFEPFQD